MAIYKGLNKIAGAGESGKSAYQSAIDGGYIGSEEEFNEDLAGIGNLRSATIDDVGKAHVAKTVVDGKVTEWEFKELFVPKAYISVKAFSGSLLTCGEQVYQMDEQETEHIFTILSLGNYEVTALKGQEIKSDTVKVDGYLTYYIDFTNRLPLFLQEVAYIRSSGVQYIDTGIVIGDGHVVELGVQFNEPYAVMQINGSLGTNVQSDVIGIYQGYFFTRIKSGGGKTTRASDSNYHVIKYDTNNKKTYMDGEELTFSTTPTYTAYSPYTLTLFARNGTKIEGYCVQQLSFCKIYKNGELQRDFVPCYVKTNGIGALYDMVSNKLFYGIGGNFLFGEEV